MIEPEHPRLLQHQPASLGLAGATPDEAYGQIQAQPYQGLAPDRANLEHKLAE